MTEFLQSLVRGLGNGSIYALLALGFVIIYKSTRVLSFAQPALMLAGATMVSYFALDMNFYLAVALAVLLASVLGLGVERTVLRPMIGKPVFIASILTIGVDVTIRVVTNGFIGQDVRPIGDPWQLSTTDVLGLEVQQRYLAMVVTTAAVVALLFAFFRYTRTGLAMRATAFDQEVALAQGVSVGGVFALSWALAAALSTLAGTFVATGAGVDQPMWTVALKAIPAIILGGLDSLGGAVAGGMAVGVVEALVQTYQGDVAPWLGQNFAQVSPYVVMLLVLLVRPYGLFGTPEVRRL